MVWDTAERRTEPFPVAVGGMKAGTPIDATAVRWVDVPVGAFPLPDLTEAIAAHDLAAGDPITPSAVAAGPRVPEGWWSVPVALPAGTAPGTRVRLVVTDPLTVGGSIEGIVVAAPQPDLFAATRDGLVAVPGDRAELVAVAAAQRLVVVLVKP